MNKPYIQAPVHDIDADLSSFICTMIPEQYTNNGSLTEEQVRLLGTANQNIQVKDLVTALSFLLNGAFEDNHIFIRVKSDKLFPYVKRVLRALLGDHSLVSGHGEGMIHKQGIMISHKFEHAVSLKFSGGYIITLDDGTLYKNHKYDGFIVDPA
ncbi:hypothetical protein Goe16_00390 [Bacillus phage vB_BsuM-Goe16]|nr:hypothetical protein Goe16_00390 [Bacillus phage vB_BsuM-Goe16]